MKRTMRFILSFISMIVFCFGGSSCWLWGNFNHIMYNYFKEESNYRKWTMTVEDFIWTDWENGRATYSLYEDSEDHTHKALEKCEHDHIYLLLKISETDKEYWGEDCEGVAFEVIYDNTQELIENGLLEDVKIGDTVTIKATDWTYGDTRFLYIAALESDSVCYLDIQTGLKNMIAYMDENRSLL